MGCAVCLSAVSCLFEAAGKIAREEGKHDLGSMPEDGFLDNLSLPPTAAELVSNPHSSRSEHSPLRNLVYNVEVLDSGMGQIVLYLKLVLLIDYSVWMG